jgi:thiol-disulfide isomerase/thioredoxin
MDQGSGQGVHRRGRAPRGATVLAMSALAPFDAAPTWLNSEPLTAEGLRGRVVLVDFWTYTCINWLRTLPYLRAWADRYADRGFVVVGVHAPEFSFEHDLDNVRRASAELGVTFPVVTDNPFAIWQAFANHYWPAVYLVDGDGKVRYRHFGEEAYAETEEAIQELLEIDEPLSDVDAGGLSEAADWDSLRSPETYVGEARSERRRRPGELDLNDWALDGRWATADEAAELGAERGSIAYCFEGRDANLVMTAAQPTGFTVTLDGEPPGDDHGLDVDAAGQGRLDEPRMYQLVRQREPRRRTVEVAFDAPGVRAYVFTFG